MRQVIKSVVCCVLLVVCACAQAQQERDSRAVRISQGPVRGFKPPNEDYFAFYNIPYATAPTGKDRFKAPLPGPVWLTERQAVDKHIVCPPMEKPDLAFDKRKQENCLIANIYVPDTDETNLPVVVYVHGGAYQMGYGNLGVPTAFVKTKKIILVTFNYRLGIHGFLCLGTEGAPGNAGMKDQVALLRWVQQNIAQFGGNPNDVTIDGYSAGSSAVDLLLLSDATKGLYNKAIPECGSNLSPWSVQYDPIEIARNFAEEFFDYKGGDDIYALENLYTSLSYEELIKHLNFEKQHLDFVPCVERDVGVERFLSKSPYEILKEGKFDKVPMLYGFADMEGLARYDKFQEWKDKMNTNFSEFLTFDLKFKDKEERQSVGNLVKKFYFGDKDVSEKTIPQYIDYFGDIWFAMPTLWSTKLQVEAGNENIYLFRFTFAEEDNLLKRHGINIPGVNGADHCAHTNMMIDLIPMFQPKTPPSQDFLKVRSTLVELWTNFIITGKPVPEGSALPAWPAASADWSPHMNIGRELELRGPLLEEHGQFWVQIYEKYYRIPSPPSPAHVPKRNTEL